MTHDVETLINILNWTLVVTAVSATSFPLLYMFSDWTSTALGRILMIRGLALALALITAVFLQFWPPDDFLVYFWILASVYSLIAITSALLTVWLWRLNFSKRRVHRGTRSSAQ